MLTHLSVRNYQSLAHVDLALEPFTVIVGPSSSGKSALVRALRTLTSNTRGSSFVSSWAKRSMIAVNLADEEVHKGVVTLWRGAKTEDNSYVIAPPHGPLEMSDRLVFTKLGGEVPQEVSEFLGIAPGDRLHFASQFDAPYLLDDSAAEVARSFAALTGVHTVFAAAREAKRVRLAQAALLRTRQADLAAITARKPEFVALSKALTAQVRAEAALGIAQSLSRQHEALAHHIATLAVADERIAATRAAAERTVPSLERAEILADEIHLLRVGRTRLIDAEFEISRTEATAARTVPSTERVEEAAARLAEYKKILVRLRDAKQACAERSRQWEQATTDLTDAVMEFEVALADAGHCPLCGQSTTEHEEH